MLECFALGITPQEQNVRKKKLMKVAFMAHRIGGASGRSTSAKAAASISEKRKAAFGRIYSNEAFSAESAFKAFAHIVVE